MVAGRARLPRGLVAALGLFAAILAAAALDLVLAARFDTSLLIPTRLRPGLLEPLALAFGCAVLGCILAAIVAVVVLERHRASPLRCFAAVLVGAGALELAVFLLLYPALDPIRSPRAIAEAAAAFTPPGEPIALVGNRAKIGGLAYYAERRVIPLPTPESIADYLAGGGRTIVVKAEKVDRLRAHAPFRVLDRRGAGKREFLVVQPSADTYGAARRRAAP
jgi:hypothetical protein